MEARPSISVVIPAFNRADTIVPCLETVVHQSLPPSQVIVVDDGSTDQTSAVISQWIEQGGNKAISVETIRQDNQGKSAALNTGVSATTGDWIAFNDSDDFWAPNKLEAQLAKLEANPKCTLCFTDSEFVNGVGHEKTNFEIRGFDKSLPPNGILEEPYRELASNPNGIFMQTIIAKSEAVRKTFPLDANLRVAQDIDLIFRLSLTGDFTFCRDALVQIDRSPERSTGLTKQHDMKSLYRIQTKERILMAWLTINDPKIKIVRKDICRNLATVQRRLAQHYSSQGQSKKARDYLKNAFRNQPSPLTWIRCLLGRA